MSAIGLLLVCATFVRASPPEPQNPADGLLRALDSAGMRSYTAAGRPGDPLNVVVIGSEDELLRLMAAARWDPADPITVRSSLRIAIDSVARKPYPDAPVSHLYVNGKKQDLAFEQPAASNPSKRHHVRFWRLDPADPADPSAEESCGSEKRTLLAAQGNLTGIAFVEIPQQEN